MSPPPRMRSPRRGTLVAGAARGRSGGEPAESSRSPSPRRRSPRRGTLAAGAASGGAAAGPPGRGPADRVKPILKSCAERRELPRGGGRSGGSCFSEGRRGRSASRGRVSFGHVQTRTYEPSPSPSSAQSPSRSRSPGVSRSLSPASSDEGRHDRGPTHGWVRLHYGKWRGPTHGGRQTAQSDDWWRTERNRRRKERQPAKHARVARRAHLQGRWHHREDAAASRSAGPPA